MTGSRRPAVIAGELLSILGEMESLTDAEREAVRERVGRRDLRRLHLALTHLANGTTNLKPDVQITSRQPKIESQKRT